MQKVNHLNYAGRNGTYNERIGPYVDEIFQTETPEPLGYLSPRRYRAISPGHLAAPRATVIYERVKPADPEAPGRFELNDLGDYEHLLFSALAWAPSATYVLAGEMGSGKTATISYLSDVLKRNRRPCSMSCKTCKPVVVLLSLDAGTRYTSPNVDVVASVRDDLINALHGRLREIFIKEELPDRFIHFTAEASEQRYARFSGFQTKLTVMQLTYGQAWQTLDPMQKTDLLLDYIRGLGSPEAQLDALMALAAFTKHTIRQDNTCFVIIIDNIDRHFEPSKQLAILLLIFGLQETGVRVLIAMRHTTFEGLGSNAAFSFSYISHAGPAPLTVGLERIRYYLNAFDLWLAEARLTVYEKTCLRDRLKAVANLLEYDTKHRGRLAALAGSSIRCGLTLLTRLLVNNTIPSDASEAPHKQDWLRAALLADSDDQHLVYNDRYIANVFSDGRSGNFSWIPLRLLQLVNAFYSARPSRNASTLMTLLQELFGTDRDEDYLAAANYLLKDTRPLLWVDGAYSYATMSELLSRNDVFSTTTAGRAYLRKLLIDNVYLQECLFAVSWPGRGAPRDVDCRTPVGRSRGARALCEILVDDDCAQYQRLIAVAARNPHLPWARLGLISLKITSTLAESSAESISRNIVGIESASDGLSECQSWLETIDKTMRQLKDLKLVLPSALVRSRQHVESAIRGADRFLRPPTATPVAGAAADETPPSS